MSRTPANKWIVLFTVVVMSFMSTLDSSIVNVALPSMQRALDATAGDIQWVSSVYLLVCCVTVLVFGRLGDTFGKVKFFQFGVAFFALGSLLCGVSTTLPALIAARVVQGLGASSAMATNMGIVTEAFPVRERGRALGVVSTFVSLGLMCGPVLGGILVASFRWESIFLINVPIGAIAFLAGFKTLPRDARRERGGGTLRERAAGALRELTSRPLVRLSLFLNPGFNINVITMFLCFLAVAATQLILPFYLEDACGYPSDAAGVMLTAIPLAMAVVGPVAGAVSDRIGTTAPCMVGLAIYAAGIALVGRLPLGAGAAMIYGAMLFMSLGTGMFQSPNNSRIMGAVESEDLGFAGSLATLVRYLGMSAGVTGGTALLYGSMSQISGTVVTGFVEGETGLFMEGFSITFTVVAVLVAAGAALTALSAALKRRARSGERVEKSDKKGVI